MCSGSSSHRRLSVAPNVSALRGSTNAARADVHLDVASAPWQLGSPRLARGRLLRRYRPSRRRWPRQHAQNTVSTVLRIDPNTGATSARRIVERADPRRGRRGSRLATVRVRRRRAARRRRRADAPAERSVDRRRTSAATARRPRRGDHRAHRLPGRRLRRDERDARRARDVGWRAVPDHRTTPDRCAVSRGRRGRRQGVRVRRRAVRQ